MTAQFPCRLPVTKLTPPSYCCLCTATTPPLLLSQLRLTCLISTPHCPQRISSNHPVATARSDPRLSRSDFDILMLMRESLMTLNGVEDQHRQYQQMAGVPLTGLTVGKSFPNSLITGTLPNLLIRLINLTSIGRCS